MTFGSVRVSFFQNNLKLNQHSACIKFTSRPSVKTLLKDHKFIFHYFTRLLITLRRFTFDVFFVGTVLRYVGFETELII